MRTIDLKDRELLELAAKTAGFVFNPTVFGRKGDPGLFGCYRDDAVQHERYWNPLVDSLYAMRLLVTLVREHGFELSDHNEAACLSSETLEYVVEVPWLNNRDHALRNAIVIAAAQAASV